MLMMAHMSSHRYMRARLQTLLQRRLAFRAALDRTAARLPSLIVSCKQLDVEQIPTAPACQAEQ